MERRQEDQNEYAKNIKGEIKFILDVESGRKGYWCLGCHEEMQAVRFTIAHYKSYFRHDAKDVEQKELKFRIFINFLPTANRKYYFRNRSL